MRILFDCNSLKEQYLASTWEDQGANGEQLALSRSKAAHGQRDRQAHKHCVTYGTGDNRRGIPDRPAMDRGKRQHHEIHHQPDKFAIKQTGNYGPSSRNVKRLLAT